MAVDYRLTDLDSEIADLERTVNDLRNSIEARADEKAQETREKVRHEMNEQVTNLEGKVNELRETRNNIEKAEDQPGEEPPRPSGGAGIFGL